jgi:outer membrane lipoprotein-sorting protein
MRRSLTLSTALALLTALSAAAQEEVDPWTVLKNVRQSLVEAGPTGASFTQTFIATGFSSGDQESGRIALALPDCIRWDYLNPFPKSFLLCGGTVHAWNEGDPTGRRYRVDRKNEPGLDLLLLGVDALKERYQATARTVEGGRIEIALSPKEKKLAELKDATLTVDPASRRVVAISYHDSEGNLTKFEITGYQDLSRQGSFSPPSNIRWVEGSQ